MRQLVLNDLRPEPLERVAGACREAGTEVITRAHDVADPGAWAETERAVREHLGELTAVVANAGVADSATIPDMSFEAWRRVLSANLDGVFLTLQAGMRLVRITPTS